MRDRLTQILESGIEFEPLESQTKKRKPSKKQSVLKPTPQGLLMIRRIFKHRDSTVPSDRERKAYNDLAKRIGDKDTFYSQIEQMERFYMFRARKTHGEADLWSHDSHTLINNWDAKIATATEFLKGKPSTVSKEDSRPAPIEPKHWREWAMHNWEGSAVDIDWKTATWESLSKYDNLGIRLEIRRNCA